MCLIILRAYEKVDINIDDPKFFEAETIEHVIDFL